MYFERAGTYYYDSKNDITFQAVWAYINEEEDLFNQLYNNIWSPMCFTEMVQLLSNIKFMDIAGYPIRSVKIVATFDNGHFTRRVIPPRKSIGLLDNIGPKREKDFMLETDLHFPQQIKHDAAMMFAKTKGKEYFENVQLELALLNGL